MILKIILNIRAVKFKNAYIRNILIDIIVFPQILSGVPVFKQWGPLCRFTESR